jgi:uncharacterized protein
MYPHPDLPPARGKEPKLWRSLLLLPFIALQLFSDEVNAAPQFPTLSGRVVDEAGILSPQTRTELDAQLAAHERATTNQVVVVTLKSLQGYDISDYGYQLGRHWGIGQKGKDNGALLIVAPSERKLRIEVGYGLEGALTDAVSRDIIERVIKPPFRRQDYDQGVRAGVGAILTALAGEYRPAPPPVTVGEGPGWSFFLPFVLPLLFFSAFAGVHRFVGRFGKRRPGGARLLFGAVFGTVFGVVAWIVLGSLIVGLVIGFVAFLFAAFAQPGSGRGGMGGGWDSGGGWSGGGGSGFSGGGGSFGGGGASGDW